MATELLEIQPHVLKFTFEVKKQSSCSIQLGNNSNQYIAFKVKTTSPKKYCVRPNTGVIKPKATCDFTVTMQAQRVAPPDMQCKDKFLIQSTVVPYGTTEEDITSDMFAKDSGNYIEEMKLRVILISPPPSPVLLPINGVSKQDPSCETTYQKKDPSCDTTYQKKDPSCETTVQKDRVLSGVENIPPPQRLAEDVKGIETAEEVDELREGKHMDSRPAVDVEGLKPVKNDVDLNISKDFEDLKSKLTMMDSKLREAESTITKLTEERSMTNVEKDRLTHELEVLSKNNVRRIQMGFPLLYVCMVALISVAVGYLIHP
ncbi:vesicle-associated protein 2-2-like isoform X2 [Corylus avellana]|uniref:vesicle-associated protein 2-2-like isoform X2 n=1 Tax=Corylus avellana TaxID=13451 RepID=UPI002869F3FD|nr:vesicle-associated protein 2-2-like isoform X2 [Corylus avellana]